MSETAATPTVAPASVDDVVALLVREDDQREQGARAPEPTTEPETSQAPEPEPQPEEQPPEPKYTVKVRGQEVEVSLDELRNGYSRTEDYKAKTAELAEQRRAAEAEKAGIAARAKALDDVLSRAPFDPVLAEGMKTDWATLARDNPAEYVARKEAYEGRVRAWQEVAHAREAAARQASESRVAEGDRAMREAVPEWGDDAKRQELKVSLARTLESYGFKPDEYQSVADHRVLLVARDAMLYRQMQAERKAAETKKAAPSVPRTVSPGTPQGGQNQAKTQAILKQAAKSGRIDDQVNAVLALLE
jgi:hypothetical protein